MPRASSLMVLLVLLAGSGGAMASSAELRVEEPLLLAAGTRLDAEPLALFLPNTAGLVELRLEAATLLLSEHDEQEATFQVKEPSGARSAGALGAQAPAARRVVLEDVVVTLRGGDHAGWLGVRASPGGALSWRAGGPASLEANATGVLGQEPLRTGGARPPGELGDGEGPSFRVASDRPALRWEGDAAWTFRGDGVLKLLGPDVAIRPAEGDAIDVDTFTRASADRFEQAQARGHRWAVLEFTDGTLSVRGASARVLAPAADATLSEPLRVRWATGEALVDGVRHQIRGPVDLQDASAARLRAAPGSGEAPALVLSFEGALTAARFAPAAPAPAPPIASAAPWLSGALALLALALLWRHRARLPWGARDADACARLARGAADAGHHEEALRWLRLARKRAPRDRTLRVEEAYLVALSGDPRVGLALLRADAPREGDADAEYHVARILLTVDAARADEAAVALAAALARAPHVLVEMEGDPTFDAVRGREDVRAAVARARRALGEA